jgi:CrcB protein
MEISAKDLVAVFLGGGLGSVMRLLIGSLAVKFVDSSFPWGTLIANFLSSLLLGLIIVHVASKADYKSWVVSFLVIGFCGGFSTFSTFSYETVKLAQNGQFIMAGANVLISFIICFFILFYLVQK